MRRSAFLAVSVLFACTAPAGGASSASSGDPAGGAGRTFVRTCASSVYGDLGPGWRRDEVTAGPVVFVAAKGYANDRIRPSSGPDRRGRLLKVLVVVDGDRPVVLSVEAPDAALAYDPARWGLRNRMRFEDADRRVRFEPCGGDQPTTQFNGAFLVRGPSCVPVHVQTEGGASASATLSFGAGDCG